MASLQGSVYKIGIIDATTKNLWMKISSSKDVGDILDKWIRSAIPEMRSVHKMVNYQFQTDDGEFKSERCRDAIE